MKIEKKPLVSVLIPTYNVVNYIEEAVDSILNQTYENIEIIIVDDCSIDGTYEKLISLKNANKRIKLFRNKSNTKIAKTLNYGLAKSSGYYIARMDGDDISLPDRIEKQVLFLQANPDVDLIGLNVIVINEVGQEIKRLKFSTDPEVSKELVKYYSPVPHFWLTKKSTYLKVGSYRIATAEDYDFLLRMASSNLRFCNHPDFLYKQRIRVGNTVTSSGLIQRKYVNYIRTLYKERVKSLSNVDSYNDEVLDRLRKTHKIERILFNYSNLFMYKFSLNVQQNKLKATMYFALTLLLSPRYQGQYFFNKIIYNRILNRNSIKRK